jgi:hypothetical protein
VAGNYFKNSDILKHSKNLQYYAPPCQVVEFLAQDNIN